MIGSHNRGGGSQSTAHGKIQTVKERKEKEEIVCDTI